MPMLLAEAKILSYRFLKKQKEKKKKSNTQGNIITLSNKLQYLRKLLRYQKQKQ